MNTHSITRAQINCLFIVLGIATFMVSIDYAIANISIPYIAGDLSVNVNHGTYVITWFAVGNALGLAMTGWLTKRVGEIRLLVYSIALFTFASWMCGFSVNYNMLVVCRFLQGLFGGPIVPLSQSLIVEYGTLETRRKDLAIWSGIVITAPVLGPIAGGYISYWYSWPWIFYVNIPIGIFCVFAIWLIMRSVPASTQKSPGDWTGIVLLLIGISALQILLDKGQEWDWLNSNGIRLFIIAVVVSFTYFVIWELWSVKPLLNLRLFSISSFTISIVCLVISYAIYFGTIVLVPLWLQQYMQYDAVSAGLAVSALGIGPILLGLFGPKLIQKIGNVLTLVVGLILFSIACFYNSYFNTQVTFEHVAFARFLFGLAFVFYVNPLVGMSVEDIPVEQLPNATGIFHFIRSLVGGIGTAIFKTLWERRTIFHHQRISSGLTPFNPSTPHIHSETQLAELNQMVDQQSALMAINDSFYFMGWCFVLLTVFLLGWYLCTYKKPKESPKRALETVVD